MKKTELVTSERIFFCFRECEQQIELNLNWMDCMSMYQFSVCFLFHRIIMFELKKKKHKREKMTRTQYEWNKNKIIVKKGPLFLLNRTTERKKKFKKRNHVHLKKECTNTIGRNLWDCQKKKSKTHIFPNTFRRWTIFHNIPLFAVQRNFFLLLFLFFW